MRTTLLAFLFASAIPAQGDHLYTVTSTSGELRRVDPLTGATLSFVPMVTTGSLNVLSCTGLSLNPATGLLYAIVRVSGSQTIRRLAQIDPATGIATIIGPLGDNFAALAIRVDGVCFAVTGDGATVPETLYTVDLNTAATTFVMALGNGSDGEAIAFGADGYLYHLSGLGVPNIHEIFERIDTFTNTITPITLSGFDTQEVLSVTPWVGGNLLVADLYDNRIVTNTNGVVRQLGTWGYGPVKGMAFIPSPLTQPFFRTYGWGCDASAGTIPLLTGSGVPSPNQTVQLNLILAPLTIGVLGIGSSNASVPFPSPACQIQILPLWAPDLFGFVTTPAGTWTLSLVLPPGLPSDLFFQAAVVDTNGIIVANPLQMHIL
ncbi:MAG TPA: hypothetical protein VFD82_10720 [Planctomycetota bacterium]|nr:hypothetical protein [Planctomycetota bacterium]